MRMVALVVLFVVSVTQTVNADIIISEVYPAGSGNTTYTADWFELTNRGATTIDITGWRMDDSSASFGTSVALEEVTSIGAGQSVIFMESSLANFAGRVQSFNQAWFGSNTSSVIFGRYSGSGVGLSTGGDGVTIFDSLAAVQASVSFGATTTGFTFDNAAGLAGTISQLSVAGVNGAFLSFDGFETGSPGAIAAVPEPTSMALVGLGLLGFAGARQGRRRS